MTRHRLLAASAAVFAGQLCAQAAAASEPWQGRPSRVLLVIGDQWLDPHGVLIGSPYEPRFDDDPGPEADLVQLAALLKHWGTPFDIARLDQETLNRYHFLGPDDRPRYGAIVWAADPAAELGREDYDLLREALEVHGISLIALSNRIRHPAIENALGLRYLGYQMTADDVVVTREHFLTRGLPRRFDEQDRDTTAKRRVRVEAPEAEVLVTQGAYPQVTLRQIRRGTSAIWIGGDHQRMFEYQAFRSLLRRAIVWATGFGLHKAWDDTVIMEMDDPGGAQAAWLDHWQYPALSEDQIRRHLIEPLKRHGALLVVNANPGFVSDAKGRIEPSWTQQFTDAFGDRQDYASTKRGLDLGLAEGVFEIHSHGWTHMQPDLVSEPGPWYGAATDAEKGEVGWYREFYDTRRLEQIPPAQQRFHMETSIRWLRAQFGVTPLHLRLGGGANSKGHASDSHVLAARAGFGVVHGCYAGRDLVLRERPFDDTPDAPAVIEAPPDGHDRGITRKPEAFAEVFRNWEGHRFIGWNEYSGYTHADVAGRVADGIEIRVGYDPHYCRHFETRASRWTLHIADWLRTALGAQTRLHVDGASVEIPALDETLEIEIPPGLGNHTIHVR